MHEQRAPSPLPGGGRSDRARAIRVRGIAAYPNAIALPCTRKYYEVRCALSVYCSMLFAWATMAARSKALQAGRNCSV